MYFANLKIIDLGFKELARKEYLEIQLNFK